MARESKVVPVLLTPHGEYFTFLKRFEALVRADEREAMVAEAAKKGLGMRNDDPFEECVREIADIRARGNT
jgi:hypothetical protein